MTRISSYNRVYKTNMTDIFELPVLLNKNVTLEYFRKLQERARNKGIVFGKGGIDADFGVFFDVKRNGTMYRFTFCQFGQHHSLDNLVIDN